MSRWWLSKIHTDWVQPFGMAIDSGDVSVRCNSTCSRKHTNIVPKGISFGINCIHHIHYFLPCPRFIQFVRHNLPFCVFVSNFVDARVLYYLLLESCRFFAEKNYWQFERIVGLKDGRYIDVKRNIKSLCLEFAFFYDVAFATSANATCKCML